MTVEEMLGRLRTERRVSSRFPVRIIFAENFKDYISLENRLKAVCDATVNVADFCSGSDLAPNFTEMKSVLATYEDQQVLVLSMGEYLRLCVKREITQERGQFRGFWEQMQTTISRTRYIVPLYHSRALFDQIVGVVDDRQQDYVWTLDEDHRQEHPRCIAVYSPAFRDIIQPDAENLTAWLWNWQQILGRKDTCAVVTNQYRNVEEAAGELRISVIDSPFRYVAERLTDGDKLQEAWMGEDFWRSMAAQMTTATGEKKSFQEAALRVLNIRTFQFPDVVTHWNTFQDLQRGLLWLWYRLYPADDYYSYACRKAASPEEIPERIRDEILRMENRNETWIAERMEAMRAIKFPSFDEEYFALLDKLPLPDTKLSLLTYQTHEEKAYAVKVVSAMLREGADPAEAAKKVQNGYPALAAYLRDSSGADEDADKYLAWYRKSKLINRLPGDGSPEISLDFFDSRLKLLSEKDQTDHYTFWIDGLGAEWIPPLLYELKDLNIQTESVHIGAALLPSKTEYNDQWDESDPFQKKWMRLDDISHKGVPDDKSYYSCIVSQLEIIQKVAKEVEKLLKVYEYVLITGDHGSSRLAALAYHDPLNIPATPPQGATVRCFGRFCELPAEQGRSYVPQDGVTKETRDGKTFVMMNDYRHFQQGGGNAAGGNTDNNDVVGEIHGGNTPEERLVPVIVCRRSTLLPPFTCQPERNVVTKKGSQAEAVLLFNRVVSTLEVKRDDGGATDCQKTGNGKAWKITLKNVSEREVALKVIANNCLVAEQVTLQVKTPGISKNTGPFGGMGI